MIEIAWMRLSIDDLLLFFQPAKTPHQPAVARQPAGFQYEPVACLRQQNACEHIRKHMLPGRQRGNADGKRHHNGKRLVPARDSLLLSHSDHAEPARQAVDGREQIVRRIRPVQPAHGVVEEACPHDIRADVCRWQQQKVDAADELGKALCTEKMLRLLDILPAAHCIIHDPEYIAAQINDDRPRQERDAAVRSRCHIIVMQAIGEEPCAVVGQNVDDQADG